MFGLLIFGSTFEILAVVLRFSRPLYLYVESFVAFNGFGTSRAVIASITSIDAHGRRLIDKDDKGGFHGYCYRSATQGKILKESLVKISLVIPNFTQCSCDSNTTLAHALTLLTLRTNTTNCVTVAREGLAREYRTQHAAVTSRGA